MLTKSILLALLASVVAAAPAAEVNDSTTAQDNRVEVTQKIEVPEGFTPPWETSDLSAGDGETSELDARQSYHPAMIIRCYAGKSCQGDLIKTSGDQWYIQPGTSYALPFSAPAYQDVSCRLDTWDDWRGKIYVAIDLQDGKGPFNSPAISGENYSPGSGQYCVDVYGHSAGRADIGMWAVATRW
ncbi:hypothetical protein Q8F55_003887 [Vanrija albida]|uniref:Secreted protein n=1 Tax=Vanrija albida TaxID=181172 RepID=A0ABR3Q5D9_9TREE